MNKEFKVLDCTLRDGGYINGWNFSEDFIFSLYEASVNAGIDVFEVGYLSKKEGEAICRNCPQTITKRLKKISSKPLIAAMLDGMDIGMEVENPEKTGIDVLRMALKKGEILDKLALISEYHEQGYLIFIQLMGITNYSDLEILEILKKIEEKKVAEYVNIGDSYGSLIPQKTKHIVELMKNNTRLKIGLHAHNNMQLGMANVLAAIEGGADIVDGSVLGMGRGGGNVPLELIVTFFEKNLSNKYYSLPILEFIDRKMLPLSQEYKWGYSLEALISGVYECHPYFTSKLIQKREYTIEQVLRTAQIINDSEVTEYSNQVLETIVESGFVKSKFDLEQRAQRYIKEKKDKVNYINRHKGRDFLVLANGPSLVRHKEIIDGYIKRNKPIVLGANNLNGYFCPDYHAFSNQKRYEQYKNTVSSESKLLLGDTISHNLEIEKYETMYFFNSSETNFNIQSGIVTTNCRSVSILLGAIAIIMGAKTIAFAGADGYLIDGEKMFYQEDDSINVEDIQRKHDKNQYYLSKLINYAQEKGVSVFSLTDTTYKFLGNCETSFQS